MPTYGPKLYTKSLDSYYVDDMIFLNAKITLPLLLCERFLNDWIKLFYALFLHFATMKSYAPIFHMLIGTRCAMNLKKMNPTVAHLVELRPKH